MPNKTQVVILCGGRGTRLKGETEVRPKPLIEIGGRPILWHIMKMYAHYGYTDFVLCLGYKGDMIKEYFLNYEAMNNDFTITLGSKSSLEFHSNHHERNWKVTLVNTGEDVQTGGRVKRVERFIKSKRFLLTYGDGVADVDLKKLVSYHQNHKKIGTVTGVHPSSRFGELIIDNGLVSDFSEKPQTTIGYVNGGFFVFEREFFSYLSADKDCYLEREPLEALAGHKQLSVFRHDNFWQCMDTQRELDLLTRLWDENKAPWRVW